MAMKDDTRFDDTTRLEEEARRAREEREQEEWREAQRTRQEGDEPQREGDVLGISDAKPNVGEPRRARSGGRSPSGIEVRDRATGIGDVPRRDGASGTDMGAGGEGTDIRPPEPPRSHAEPDADE
jgi:hypothetical protein